MMPIKKNLQFNRIDFTYESKDGDAYDITYMDTGDSEYFEVNKVGDPVDNKRVYDVDMWRELLSERDKLKKPAEVIRVNRANISPPRIQDLRTVSPQDIQGSVNHSMDQIDDTVVPVESFSPVQDTPEEWKLDEERGWKKEVVDRQSNIQSLSEKKGQTGKEVKRVDASDLI